MAYGLQGAAVTGGVGQGLEKAAHNIVNMWMMGKRLDAIRGNAEAAKMRAASQAKVADAYASKLNREGLLGMVDKAASGFSGWSGASTASGGRAPMLGPSTPANQRATASALAQERTPKPPAPEGPDVSGMARVRPMAYSPTVPRPAPPSPMMGAAQLVQPQPDDRDKPLYSEDE